jgi:hypothetical protein
VSITHSPGRSVRAIMVRCNRGCTSLVKPE